MGRVNKIQLVLSYIISGLIFISVSLANTKEEKVSFDDFSHRLMNCLQTSQKSIKHYFKEEFEEALKLHDSSWEDVYESIEHCEGKTLTSGKSGAIFVKTANKKFVLKSISSSEVETFQQISHDYFQYVFQNPESLLVPLYGIFKIGDWNPEYILLMPNLIPIKTEQTRIYDLKGREKKNHQKRHGIIDDNSFPDPPPFSICPSAYSQILFDTEFLERNGLMDYSLLVVQQKSEKEVKPHIIDFLASYHFKKEVAHFFKTFIWNEQQISTISPQHYAQRFKNLANHLLHVDENKSAHF